MKLTPFVLSTFTSDGGAMFGLVPKAIWSRLVTSNPDNTINQQAASFLFELEDGSKGIVDTGCGDPLWMSEKERRIHGMADNWPLAQALQALHLSFEDIDHVVLTHAHWDHAGALVDPDKKPLFPNARVYLHQIEWDLALGGDPLLYKAYPQYIREALAAAKEQVTLVTDETPGILPGLELRRTGGHTEGHCAVHFHDVTLPDGTQAEQAILPCDVVPSQHHLRMVFQTAYDTFPLETRAWKQKWLPQIAENPWLLLFAHDTNSFGASLRFDARGRVQIGEYLSDSVEVT